MQPLSCRLIHCYKGVLEFGESLKTPVKAVYLKFSIVRVKSQTKSALNSPFLLKNLNAEN